MSKRPRVGRLLRSRGFRLVGCALVAIALFVAAYNWVPHLADTMSVRVTRYPQFLAPSSTAIFAKTYHDTELVHRTQAELDSLTSIPAFSNVHCEIGGIEPWFVYELHFTWRGIPVQDAKVSTDACGFWAVKALGIPWPGSRFATPEAWARLHDITGMPDWHDAPSG